jgi:hypothetical protein
MKRFQAKNFADEVQLKIETAVFEVVVFEQLVWPGHTLCLTGSRLR